MCFLPPADMISSQVSNPTLKNPIFYPRTSPKIGHIYIYIMCVYIYVCIHNQAPAISQRLETIGARHKTFRTAAFEQAQQWRTVMPWADSLLCGVWFSLFGSLLSKWPVRIIALLGSCLCSMDRSWMNPFFIYLAGCSVNVSVKS